MLQVTRPRDISASEWEVRKVFNHLRPWSWGLELRPFSSRLALVRKDQIVAIFVSFMMVFQV